MGHLKGLFNNSAITLILVVFASAGAVSAGSQSGADPLVMGTEYERIRLVRIADGFQHPWAVAFLPDGRYLVTERPGRLNIVDNGAVARVSGVPEVFARGQGGLLDVSVHPQFEENGWVYLTYSKPNGRGETATALARGRLQGTRLEDVEDLFVQDRYSSPGRHYGSRLAWTGDGKLLMTVGDRGADPPRAQDLADHAGTVLRLNDDGTAAADNPFVGRDGVHNEIFAYGVRNIQGLVIDPETGEIWATDHGPRGGDELLLIEAGNNYGWPVVTRGRDYGTQGEFRHAQAREMEGMTPPIYEFLPTLAPSGLALVTAGTFRAWNGDLLAGGLRSQRIRRVVVENHEVIHEEELLLNTIGRIRDVREGPDGNIYVLNDESSGALYRIEPAH
jgi:aldose sugar dehydrogenase